MIEKPKWQRKSSATPFSRPPNALFFILNAVHAAITHHFWLEFPSKAAQNLLPQHSDQIWTGQGTRPSLLVAVWKNTDWEWNSVGTGTELQDIPGGCRTHWKECIQNVIPDRNVCWRNAGWMLTAVANWHSHVFGFDIEKLLFYA